MDFGDIKSLKIGTKITLIDNDGVDTINGIFDGLKEGADDRESVWISS